MLEGKELVLATRKFTQENTRLSWFYTIQTFSLLVGSIILISLSSNFFVQLSISIVYGLLIVRAFVIYHDYMHGTILKKSKSAEYIFDFFGILVLAPKSVWKTSHDFHHHNNSKLRYSSIGSYPILTKNRFEQCTSRDKRKYLWSRHPIFIILGYFFSFFIGMCLIPVLSNVKKHNDALIALILHIAIYICILYFSGLSSALFLITIPTFIAGAIGSYLFYIQHNFPSVNFTEESEWTYTSAALESSSYLVASPIIHWITANIGYHHIHHLNSKIPFYRLSETMKSLPELQNPKTVTLSIKDIIACFNLKVWDTQQEKMVNIKIN